jgi:hypothetical protein
MIDDIENTSKKGNEVKIGKCWIDALKAENLVAQEQLQLLIQLGPS